MTLKDLQQKIEVRFEKIFGVGKELEKMSGQFPDGLKMTTKILAKKNIEIKSFISLELEAAIRDFAETVRVDKNFTAQEVMLVRNKDHAEGLVVGWNTAVAEQEEKIKRFFAR